jgi:hypothetical protein
VVPARARFVVMSVAAASLAFSVMIRFRGPLITSEGSASRVMLLHTTFGEVIEVYWALACSYDNGGYN